MDLSTARWRKSSRSGTASNCVEVARTTNEAAVRDSKNAAGPALAFSTKALTAFLDGLK